jgi:hypothetical protein
VGKLVLEIIKDTAANMSIQMNMEKRKSMSGQGGAVLLWQWRF